MIEDSDILTELAALEARTQAVQRLLSQRRLQLVTTQAHPSYASYAAALIAGRRALAGYLDCAYFGDPAFDMLLDLFVAAERDELRPVKACTIASGAPATTALRYLDLMEADGLLTRHADPTDGRRSIIRLTDDARERVRSWLEQMSSLPLRREPRR